MRSAKSRNWLLKHLSCVTLTSTTTSRVSAIAPTLNWALFLHSSSLSLASAHPNLASETMLRQRKRVWQSFSQLNDINITSWTRTLSKRFRTTSHWWQSSESQSQQTPNAGWDSSCRNMHWRWQTSGVSKCLLVTRSTLKIVLQSSVSCRVEQDPSCHVLGELMA